MCNAVHSSHRSESANTSSPFLIFVFQIKILRKKHMNTQRSTGRQRAVVRGPQVERVFPFCSRSPSCGRGRQVASFTATFLPAGGSQGQPELQPPGWLPGIHSSLWRHLHVPREPTPSDRAPRAGGVHAGHLLGVTGDLHPHGSEGHVVRQSEG